MNDNSTRGQEGEKPRYGEEQLRLLLEAAAGGFWDWDIRSGNVYLSPSYWEMTGYRAEDTRNDLESFRRLVHPEDWPFVLNAINEHLAGKSPQGVIEYRMIAKDGQEKWILERGQVIEREPDGTPLRMVGTVSDIADGFLISGPAQADLCDKVNYETNFWESSPGGWRSRLLHLLAYERADWLGLGHKFQPMIERANFVGFKLAPVNCMSSFGT